MCHFSVNLVQLKYTWRPEKQALNYFLYSAKTIKWYYELIMLCGDEKVHWQEVGGKDFPTLLCCNLVWIGKLCTKYSTIKKCSIVFYLFYMNGRYKLQGLEISYVSVLKNQVCSLK